MESNVEINEPRRSLLIIISLYMVFYYAGQGIQLSQFAVPVVFFQLCFQTHLRIFKINNRENTD